MTDTANIFDLRSILGAQIRQAAGVNPFDSVTVDPNANLIEIRLTHSEAAALSAHYDRLAAENQRLSEQLTVWLCVCPSVPPEYFEPDAECPIHGDPKSQRVSMRGLLRYREAFEALHARLLRDLPGDASELPPPGDECWARALDDLLTFAAETAHAAEGGA